ncbi:MAG: hypothetical protein IMF15_06910 [Proteobacteria bacterium]|nr:hypothetical protein [Pseudomonadota bacterium]
MPKFLLLRIAKGFLMMAFFSRPVFNILCTATLLCSYQAMASDDEYLKMLEGEAEDVKLDQSGQLKDKEQINQDASGITKTNWKWEGDMEGDNLPLSLAQDEFATVLKQNFYGTFVFYRKLNSVDQQTVYYHYSKASPAALDPIRQDILNHLKK